MRDDRNLVEEFEEHEEAWMGVGFGCVCVRGWGVECVGELGGRGQGV